MIQGCRLLPDKKNIFLKTISIGHPTTSNQLVGVQVTGFIINDILEYYWDYMSL